MAVISPNRIDIDALKAAARGRWAEILTSVGGIDSSLLDGKHRGCPKCGGVDRFRVFDDFLETGGIFCNQCHSEKNSDGLATLQWLTGESFPQVLNRLADFLGVANGNGHHRGKPNIVEVVAQAKRVPLESWMAFGAHEAQSIRWPPLHDRNLFRFRLKC